MSKQETAEKGEMNEKSLVSNLAELELEKADDDSKLTKVLTYVIFFMLGLGVVLPWNVVITANEFFSLQFRNSKYASNFLNYFSVISFSVQLLFLVPAILTQKKNQIYKRLFTNVSCVTFIFLLMAIFPFFEPSELTPETKFLLSMIPIVSCAVLSVLGFTDVFALATMFPPIYIQGLVSGQAIGGLIVALIQFTITATSYSEAGQDKQFDGDNVAATLTRAKAYFGAALLISLLNLGLLFALPLLSTYRKYTAIYMTNSATTTSINIKTRSQQILSALSTVRYTALAVLLNFVVTLALFPSITSSVRTNYPNASGLYVALFVSLHFVLFNIGDVTGRFLLGFPALRPRSSKFLLFFSLARLIFFLLFLTSRLDFNNPNLTQAFPVWINNDVIFFILMFLFAVSNGYVGSGSMMFAPSQASDPLIIPVIGNVMSFSLTVGLAFGSFLSFALRAAVCQCNSFSS